MKLQDMIDAAFGASEAPRAPAEELKERERAFSEQAKVLRPATSAEMTAGPYLIEVVRYRGHWRTMHSNKRSSPYPDQARAIAAAKKLAIAKRKEGREVRLVLQRTDGNAVVQAIDE